MSETKIKYINGYKYMVRKDDKHQPHGMFAFVVVSLVIAWFLLGSTIFLLQSIL